MGFLSSIRQRARRLRVDAIALGLAARHPGTPWFAKLVVAGCVVYAVMPADFVPDVIPVLGVVDDLVFIPLALGFARRFVPSSVMAECRARAEAAAPPRPFRRLAAWLRRGRGASGRRS
jgi:uncharacterized membrane protein YkvA (DUF1232 family)